MSLLKIAVHPGRILKEEYLQAYGISAGKLAAHLGLPRTRIERLVKEETSISIDTARRLAATFGTTPNFWLNLQTNYDVRTSDGDEPLKIQPLRKHA